MAATVHHLPPDARQPPEPLARFFAVPAAVAEAPVRPRLRVIPGGRTAALRHRRPASVYRRRRLLVGTMAAAALFFSVLAIGRLGEAAASAVGAISEPAQPMPGGGADPETRPSTSGWVVEPGDTLWSIASELRPAGDVRPVVDELARRNGGPVLEAGQRLDVGGLRG